MPTLTIFRLQPECDRPNGDFETLLAEDVDIAESETVTADTYTATAFIATASARMPTWAPFVSTIFRTAQIEPGVHPSAIIFIRTHGTKRLRPATFALTFGPGGRFMLDPASYVRGFGLKAALNLIFPTNSPETPRLKSVDSKRRDASILRSRKQASEQVDFEAFDVSQLRDVLSKAVGQPHEAKWGSRVQGGDALVLTLPEPIPNLGEICVDIDRIGRRRDYRKKFSWIDNIQPLDDPTLRQKIEMEIVERLKTKQLERFSLSPPEILDWSTVSGFRYHFDRRGRAGGVLHPDIRIQDYVRGLDRTGHLDFLSSDFLRRSKIYAQDGDGNATATWSAWRCLVAEIVVASETYILDEGELFRVDPGYLSTLDEFLARIPEATCTLPPTTVTKSEGAYNDDAAKAPDILMLDRQNVVTIPGKTTAIEICDLLTTDRHLIHVKRHLSSSTLSHLFAQGIVSAELLHESPEFLKAVRAKVSRASEEKKSKNFSPLFANDIRPSEWKVVYAVAAEWKGPGLGQLPFFSKINLREAYQKLDSRGYGVEFARIPAARTATPKKT